MKEDIFTSIHIDEFEVGARDTKLGPEEITRDIPNVGDEALTNLGPDGVIRVGAEVKPGDILVGKITPKSETELAPEERLLRAIFGEKAADVKDTSLNVPSGTYGIVMDVKVSSRREVAREKLTPAETKRQLKAIDGRQSEEDGRVARAADRGALQHPARRKNSARRGERETGEIIIPANRKITKTLLRKLATALRPHRDRSVARSATRSTRSSRSSNRSSTSSSCDRERSMDRVESGDDVDPGIIKPVKVYIASKRKLSVGDKMAGRHGNKGVVATIVPEEDMPFLADGTPVEIVLNPLGVPSPHERRPGARNAPRLGGQGARLEGRDAGLRRHHGKENPRLSERGAGRSTALPGCRKTARRVSSTAAPATPFDQEIVVGYIYMMKLGHLVADKIHARAVGPYSLVTQQPLGGKAQYGGQRFGEMEVWAMEAYGAAYTLQELLTVKSDDVQGRTRIYESIVKGDNSLEAGTPESFNVLIKEMQSLGLDVKVGGQAPSFPRKRCLTIYQT